MARYSSGARATGAGSATLPLGSLYAAATAGVRVREVGVFNTTTTALVVALVRLTTAGTSSALTVNAEQDPNGPPALGVARNSHSSTGPTLGDDLGYRATLGAAAGAGIIWTFGDAGLVITASATNAIGIYVPTGTGQICDFYFVWDE